MWQEPYEIPDYFVISQDSLTRKTEESCLEM